MIQTKASLEAPERTGLNGKSKQETQKTLRWEWEDNGSQLMGQHTIAQRESTQNIRRELREAKEKGEPRKQEQVQPQPPLRHCYCVNVMLPGTKLLPAQR